MRKALDRICKHCQSDDWYVWSTGNLVCAPCKLAKNKVWDKKNKDKRLEYVKKNISKHVNFTRVRKDQHLRRNYGITIEQYDNLFEIQGKVCAICNQENAGRYWHLDHDHVTGKVRAILCHHCNLLLGYSRENLDFLKKTIQYLESHKA